MKTSYWLGTGLVLASQLAQAQGTLTFTALAAMPVPHYGMGYCQNGSFLYQVGGGSPGSATTADVYRYSISQNVWAPGAVTATPQRFQLRTFTSNLPPRRNAAAAIVGDVLYVWGGNTASLNSSALGDVWQANVAAVATAATPAAGLALLQAYPNPLATGPLRVLLPGGAASAVWLSVCDAQGREVQRRSYPPGTTTADLDLSAQAAGLYLVRAEATAGQPIAACRLVRQ